MNSIKLESSVLW